ncbi:hypothetical protein JOF48_002204 [Arthrobacter stackebrandtii]|uniref:Histidine kinase n=1 Tax=Arthrobacter stackebrandtii TaxID=272161 RepID=A0ABS4YY75_9MICC|nr:hypothetical protein [Arthrobacter stackebrandtii]MBP2413405.1 hypothetical protein [Arthrobacter stackebrandtii]PYH00742.1 hypothetical protein CVV67_09535 [Arthrobacter stackebrandtii]
MTETELRLTDHELLTLLSMTPTESAAVTLGLLRLDQHGDNELLHNAGLTTLMVRGLAAPQGEKIVPVDKTAIVGTVLSQAQEWLEIKLTTPSSEHVLFAVGSNVGAVLLSISPFGVHEIQPIESGTAMLELALHLCNEYLTGAAEGLPATAVVRRLRVDAEGVVAQLTAVETGDWVLRSGTESEFVEDSVPAADAVEQFKAALNA